MSEPENRKFQWERKWRKGEGKPDGMPEQLPEEGTEGRKLREMAEVQGYAGNVKSEKDRPGGESEVDFTHRSSPELCPLSSVVSGTEDRSRKEPENSGGFDRNIVDIMGYAGGTDCAGSRFREPAGGVQGRKRTGEGSGGG
ncbi:hypothetical protein K438DRAFT_1770832 [Mycena galopus ATCC 62051]|nr:hypothetical protein K438DRAFT_1770832 [Mycena galopus ATCC 62051]